MTNIENHVNPNGHQVIGKGWGSEEWIINSEKYCGKILRIHKDKKTSWHYHKLKDEVMYVHVGCVKILYGFNEDINHLNTKEIILNEGQSFHVEVGLIHQIIGLENSQVFEFSTQHFDEDSYRLIQGD